MIYLIVKEYNDNLAKRQPWYTISLLKRDLESHGYEVNVVPTVPAHIFPDDIIIKTFSFKDVIFPSKVKRKQLYYLMSFSLYKVRDILRLDYKTLKENFDKIDRILLMAFMPHWYLFSRINQATCIISISDRSYDYCKGQVDQVRYIPFDLNESYTKIKYLIGSQRVTWGYFGPAYNTRYFFEVIGYALWLIKEKKIDEFVFFIREDADLPNNVRAALNKCMKYDKIKIVVEFSERDDLLSRLALIDVFVLPFKIVMSEFPVVVLESLYMEKIVITTKECGLYDQFNSADNLLIIDGLGHCDYDDIYKKVCSTTQRMSKQQIRTAVARSSARLIEKIKHG